MMEQQLKERLVGATVLVLLAIILIPAILDGPGGNNAKVEKRLDLPVAGERGERRTVRIPLDEPQADAATRPAGTSAGEATEAADVETSPIADETVTAPASGETALAETTDPESATSPPSDSEPPVDASPDQPAVSEQPWTVQVGSFSSEENAAGLVERLQSLGYDDAYISRYDDGSRIHYRVRVGGYPDRERAAVRAEDIRERSEQPARPAKN